jgi:hypothetical protein
MSRQNKSAWIVDTLKLLDNPEPVKGKGGGGTVPQKEGEEKKQEVPSPYTAKLTFKRDGARVVLFTHDKEGKPVEAGISLNLPHANARAFLSELDIPFVEMAE